MAYLINTLQTIPFRVVNASGTPITGLVTGNFGITLFRDAVVDSTTVTITETGAGLYKASFTPTVTGFYYINLVNGANSYTANLPGFYITSGIDISAPPAVVNLTQNFGSTNALQINFVTDPQEYVLNIFLSSDWDLGTTDPNYIVNYTELDESGNWLTTPLSVQPGTYHLVIQNNKGVSTVFKPYLTLS